MQQFLKIIVFAVFIMGLAGGDYPFILAVQAGQSQSGKQRVARGIFSTNIVDREPVDQVLVLSTAVNKIYFFTDLRQYQGQIITHRWEYEGKLIMEKTFKIGGPRWRVYSKQDLDPDMTGTWTVVIRDGNNWPIYAALFQYIDKVSGNEKSVILPFEQ